MKRTTFETKFKKFLLQMNPNKIIFSKYMVYKKRSHLSFFFSPERVRVSLTILRISPSGHFINIPHKRNSYADTDYFSCVILFFGSDRSSRNADDCPSGIHLSGKLILHHSGSDLEPVTEGASSSPQVKILRLVCFA